LDGALVCPPAGDGQSEKLKSELPRYSVSDLDLVWLRPKAALSAFAVVFRSDPTGEPSYYGSGKSPSDRIFHPIGNPGATLLLPSHPAAINAAADNQPPFAGMYIGV
jgi:hypothetical protein